MPLRHSFAASLSACMTAAVLSCAPGAAQAQATGLDLAKAKNCLACHQVTQKVVGPSYQSVAQRYAGQPDAVDHLVNSIREGSAKRWGAIPMPAQKAMVSPDEAKQLAQWILAQKP